GRYVGGEGYLGFSQALFVKGAKSLVLSQWRGGGRGPAPLVGPGCPGPLGDRAGRRNPRPPAPAPAGATRAGAPPPREPGGQALAPRSHCGRGRQRAGRVGPWHGAPPGGPGRGPIAARRVVGPAAGRGAAVCPPLLLGLVHPDR